MPTPGAVGGFHEAFRIGATTFYGAPDAAHVLPVAGINVYDIMRRQKLVLTRAAVDALEARFK